MTARILTCTNDEYYADPCEVPSLSQSIAKTLITRSPAHAWSEHPRLGATPRESTKAKDDGSLLHALIVGNGPELVVLSFDTYRTARAQELRDEALNAGRIPVLEHKLAEFTEIATRVRANLAAEGFVIPEGSRRELAIEWEEEGEHGPILCRCKQDITVLETGQIFDLKKISSADPRTCSRNAIEYGYDIQYTAYTSALAKLLPEFEGRVDFVFGFCELDPPYAVYPCRPDGMLREHGARRWSRALGLWERCLRNDDWPGYTRGIATLEAPPWALSQEENNASF